MNPEQLSQGDEMKNETTNKRQKLVEELKKRYGKFKRRATFWKWSFYFISILIISLSASAALINQVAIFGFTEPDAKDISTILMSLAGIFGSISALVKFTDNWHANRSSYYKIDMLVIRAKNIELPEEKIIEEYASIVGNNLDSIQKSD